MPSKHTISRPLQREALALAVSRRASRARTLSGEIHEIVRAPFLPEELEEQSARGFEVACNLFRTQLVFGRFSGCDINQQWKH